MELNGTWKLYYFPQGQFDIAHPSELTGLGLAGQPIAAEVPGNVELDLARAGVLQDPYVGDNVLKLREYETHEWWYVRTFTVDAALLKGGRGIELLFRGVDCLATYWLDGEEIGSSDNMFIEHRFDVTERLAAGREHTLAVRLRSPVLEAMAKRYEPSNLALPVNYESLWIRKAAHMFGWDIMPRAVSAGLWRPVELVVREPDEIEYIYAVTREASEHSAKMQLFFRLRTDAKKLTDLRLRVSGVCGDSRFAAEKKIRFVAGHIEVAVDRPKLWWPRGYGEANLYEVTLELLHAGNVIARRTETIGLRTLELLRTDVSTPERPGRFQFVVNGVPIQIKGTNWVPMDMFHSKDAARYEEAIRLAADLECNMLRCWGGNVYEDHAFFDLCDRSGILVWQDFAMACALYPQAPEFRETLRREAEAVVRKLRNHPSLAVWCGDNECDEFALQHGVDPNNNVLTRQVLPEVLHECDPYRPYVPSSPYVSPEAYRLGTYDVWPERHLWGPRDYFKSSYYTSARMHFIGEGGYHGCPNLSTMRRFLDPEFVWPWQDNPQWVTHGTDPLGDPESMYHFRVKLMADQIGELFGEIPETPEEFIVASQISQAEAKKYLIESSRLKADCTGILWWNLLDGWPQFSDAVVDYYGGKKLAYYYIRRAQQPVCIMVDEPESWHVAVKASNDTRSEVSGTYIVRDGDSGETLLSGSFAAPAGETATLGRIRAPYSAQRLLLIEWEAGGVRGGNHYVLGSPAFSYARYRREWLPKIAALPCGFDADGIGK